VTEPAAGASEITALLIAWGDRDRSALKRLLPHIHEELRRIARPAERGVLISYNWTASRPRPLNCVPAIVAFLKRPCP
jgi:hypothetical protein